MIGLYSLRAGVTGCSVEMVIILKEMAFFQRIRIVEARIPHQCSLKRVLGIPSSWHGGVWKWGGA